MKNFNWITQGYSPTHKMILEEISIFGSKEPETSFASNETVLMGDIPEVADKEEAAPVAPGNGKRPISLLSDRFW